MENKKVKIIATIGPASDSEAVLKKLMLSGVNVFRLNFSHATPDYFAKVIKRINKLKKKLRINVVTFLDLPGPKIRTGILPNGKFEIKEGERYILGPNGDIPVSKSLLKALPSKGKISLSDGKIQIEPLQRIKNGIVVEALDDGTLLNNQSINAANLIYEKKYPTNNDIAGIRFGLRHGINVFALSFVSRKEDIQKARRFTGKNSIIITKVERDSAVKDFSEIANESDVIMIARGDLGLNIDMVKVPFIQRKLIKEANKLCKPIITATQVLESMIRNPIPTRAELDDTFTAIMEGTDAIMLSEETAIGSFPVKSVQTLRKLIDFNYKKLNPTRYPIKVEEDALIDDVVDLARNTRIKSIIMKTSNGKNVLKLSRYHIDADIFAITNDTNTANLLSFSRGVIPIHSNRTSSAFKAVNKNYNVSRAIMVYDVPRGKKAETGLNIINL
jgi:pyruvate kinase